MPVGSDSIDIVGAIGEVATIALAEAFGGTRLYVPSKVNEEHAISRAIGFVAARALSQRYAPDQIAVPMLRDRRAQHYRRLGDSHAAIARRLGMTEAGVQRLLKRLGEP